MRRIFLLIVALGLFAILREAACADEVWTYKFIVNGSRPYRAECECYSDLYADVAGSFSILLNWQNMTGRILELDDHLTNFASGTYSPATGLVMTPLNLPEADYGIIPPWETDFSFPDGHFGYANQHGALGVEQRIPAFSWDLWVRSHVQPTRCNVEYGHGGHRCSCPGDQCDGGVFKSDNRGRLQRGQTR